MAMRETVRKLAIAVPILVSLSALDANGAEELTPPSDCAMPDELALPSALSGDADLETWVARVEDHNDELTAFLRCLGHYFEEHQADLSDAERRAVFDARDAAIQRLQNLATGWNALRSRTIGQ
jgi:predicted trehalose synthase